MNTYLEYGKKIAERNDILLKFEGLGGIPKSYEGLMKIDVDLRKRIAENLSLVLSDNYEHFMACLPGKKYAAQHVLARKQIGGFTVACGFWKWLEFLSHRITRDEVELVADFFSGKYNNFPRQFNKDYWIHVVDDFDGYLPIRIEYPGEGTVFTGVPFPVAQIYGEKPAVWLNEPMYIQIGYLSHIATVAAQFAEAIGDSKRFIEVMFRALPNKELSSDALLAILIGGGITGTSNDLGAFINGRPFKPSGTTGHCFYQQWEIFKESLRELLGSPLGPYSTVLPDIYDHRQGFNDLQDVLDEGYNPPFAERPDSGDTLQLGTEDLLTLQDKGIYINAIFEDGKEPKDTLEAECTRRRQYNIAERRFSYGAGSAFLGPRRALEFSYKAAYFHNGTVEQPTNEVETMKICQDDKMKQSLPGLISWFLSSGGVYLVGSKDEALPHGYAREGKMLYDGLSDPGNPYFDPDYNPNDLAQCKAITDGIEKSLSLRSSLGPDFTHQFGENRASIALTKKLRQKREAIYKRALKNE